MPIPKNKEIRKRRLNHIRGNYSALHRKFSFCMRNGERHPRYIICEISEQNWNREGALML